jgi:hypothetical protein
MAVIDSQSYAPLLRLKQGEYTALPALASDVATHLLPHFVLPPPTERDPELARLLTPSELIHEHAKRLGRHWPLRPCLLDPRFLYRKLEANKATEWLPSLFSAAIRANAKPTLVSDLSTIEGPALEGIQRVIKDALQGMALRVTADEVEQDGFAKRVQSALLKVGIKPTDCVLVLDFGSPDFSQADVVAEIIVDKFQRVMEIGLWGQVIWQATSYPETNPASRGEVVELPRKEWLSWQLACNLDNEVRKHLMFGDFAADSAKFSFKSVRVVPIPHLRYSTVDKWIVARGPSGATRADALQTVAAGIIRSGHFAGPAFSVGDRFISEAAAGDDGPGTPMIWRRVNTIHHLTRVTDDVGTMRGYQIRERTYSPRAEQASFKFRTSDSER